MPELYKYSYRVLKLDLTPGLTDFELPIDAEKVVYASPTDGPELSIRLQAKSNDQIPLRPQGEIVAPFQRLYISAAAVAKTVFLLIGSPKDIQLTGRDVSISGFISSQDLWLSNIRTGTAFFANHQQAVGAGTFAKFQLFNPANNTKTLLLMRIKLRSTVAVTYGFFRHNATVGTVSGWVKNNLLLGSAAPSGQHRELADASAPGIAFNSALFNLPANTDVYTDDKFSFAIPPGQGFHVWFAAVAGAHEVSFSHIEI